MPLETISSTWRPCKKTSNTLKSPKYGFSQEQVNKLGKQFIQRYLNKQLPDANSKFFEFVRTSGVGHKMPKPDNSQDIKQAEERKANFENASPDSAERAEEVKSTNDGVKTQEEAIAWIQKERNYRK